MTKQSTPNDLSEAIVRSYRNGAVAEFQALLPTAKASGFDPASLALACAKFGLLDDAVQIGVPSFREAGGRDDLIDAVALGTFYGQEYEIARRIFSDFGVTAKRLAALSLSDGELAYLRPTRDGAWLAKNDAALREARWERVPRSEPVWELYHDLWKAHDLAYVDKLEEASRLLFKCLDRTAEYEDLFMTLMLVERCLWLGCKIGESVIVDLFPGDDSNAWRRLARTAKFYVTRDWRSALTESLPLTLVPGGIGVRACCYAIKACRRLKDEAGARRHLEERLNAGLSAFGLVLAVPNGGPLFRAKVANQIAMQAIKRGNNVITWLRKLPAPPS